MPENLPQITILQFGTGRFLQAHVDMFLHEAAQSGQEVGKVCMLQSSMQPEGRRRAEAFNRNPVYPVRIEGMSQGRIVQETHDVSIVDRALLLADPRQWQQALELVRGPVRCIISNTADRGYETNADDRPDSPVPKSFPAKLLLLLRERHAAGARPLTILPCELINGNADRLKSIVLDLGRAWHFEDALLQWIDQGCAWANTLVDRIVAESLEPIGAVAEPYALWAVQEVPGLAMPCTHSAIAVVKDLYPYEMLKLGVLNLSHTFLVELWMRRGRPEALQLVSEAIGDPDCLAALRRLLATEVLPVLRKLLPDHDPDLYAQTVIERFSNPFLRHRLSDIANNHEEKIRRRLLMVREHAQRIMPDLATPLLDSCLRGE